MEMTKFQNKYFKMGSEFKSEYPEYCISNALEYLDSDILETIAEDEEAAIFFTAGFSGREPEWVTAIRYGEIPECGYSTNWATGDREGGVSCLKIIRKESDYELVHPVYEITGAKKIVVEGWYFGKCGSDGEPIINFAIKKGDYKK